MPKRDSVTLDVPLFDQERAEAAVRELLLDDSREVARLLSQKAGTEEASEYKAWAMSVAENVARAAREGGFLGFGGEQVSAGEKALFAELARALETESSPLV